MSFLIFYFIAFCFTTETKIAIFNTTGFSYRQQITVSPLGLVNGNETSDFYFFLNTKEMIEKDYILKDCSDIVFVRNSTSERIPHFIENECDQENTRFYLSMKLSDSVEENNIFMYFRYPKNMDSLESQFDGSFFEMRSTACNEEKGWKYDESFEGNFVFVNSEASGTIVSTATGEHNHLLVAISESLSDSEQQGTDRRGVDGVVTTPGDHNHVFVVDIRNSEPAFPEYKEKFFCKNNKLEITKGAIGLFENTGDIPSGFTQLIEKVQDKFVLIAGGQNGATGGNNEHDHSFSGQTYKSDQSQSVSTLTECYEPNNWYKEYPEIKQDYYHVPQPTTMPKSYISTSDHMHNIVGSCTKGRNTPENIVDFIIGVNEIEDYQIPNDDKMLYMSDQLPPIGFDIDVENDGFFLRPSDNYQKTQKGSNTVQHSHDCSIAYETADNQLHVSDLASISSIESHYATCYYHGRYGGTYYWRLKDDMLPYKSNSPKKEHQHTVPSQTKEGSIELPVRNIMLLKRKPTIANVTVSELIEKLEEIIDRDKDVDCFPECINNGTCISSGSYYYCNCTEQYTGTYCEDLVDTGKDIGGVDYSTLFVTIGVVGGIIFILAVCVIVTVIMIIACIVLQRKKRTAYSKKMIDSLVSGIDKETELQEQKEQLEEEKIKLETDKKKLEAEKQKEKEEKEQLKRDLELLKAEKMKIEQQSNLPIKPINIIQKDDIKNLKKLIGMKNGYETFKGRYKDETVMFRKFKEDLFNNKNYFQGKNLLEYEVNEYSTFNHPNIMKFKAISLTPTVGVVTEFPFNGSLVTYFNRKKRKTLTFLQKVRIFYEIANGIQYLHKKGKKHGDLRAGNCWLTKELRPILDFGFNKSIDREHIYSPYCAPELIKPQPIEEDDDDDDDIEDSPHLKADIYALGILMFEIVSENFNLYNIPKGKKEKIGEKAANDQEFRPSLKRAKYYPNWFINLIKMCWNADPERRPNITRIKSIIETIAFGDDEED